MKFAWWTSAARKHYAKGFCNPHYKKAGRKSADQVRLEALKASAGRIQEEIGTIQQLLEAS